MSTSKQAVVDRNSLGHASCCALKRLSALSACLLTAKFSKSSPVQAMWLQGSWKIHCLETAFEPRTKSRRGTYKCQWENITSGLTERRKEQGWHWAATHHRQQKCILPSFFTRKGNFHKFKIAVFKSIFFNRFGGTERACALPFCSSTSYWRLLKPLGVWDMEGRHLWTCAMLWYSITLHMLG